MDELFSRVALAQTEHFSPMMLCCLLRVFGSASAIYAARDAELLGVQGMTYQHIASLRRFPEADCLSVELEAVREMNIKTCAVTDADYPLQLREVTDAPPLLFIRGEILSGDSPAIAIVGTRKPTQYGKNIARMFAIELVKYGITIVSGLALGIDSEVHRATLEANGRTLAVIGCGHAIPYPKQNQRLANVIKDNGALISEYPPHTPPRPYHFPVRNRIISGLCAGVIVVEAGERSGALITAHHAAEQGREVFAVPGCLGSYASTGPHALIKQGAVLIRSVADIFDELPVFASHVLRIEPAMKALNSDLTPSELPLEQRELLRLISAAPIHLDAILMQDEKPSASIIATLTQLEINGWIKALPGKFYVRS